MILDRIMASRYNSEYFRRTQERPLGLIAQDAADLRPLVVDREALIPAPERSKLAHIHLLCTGCGIGHEEYGLFEEVLEAQWTRREELLQDCTKTSDEFRGLAEIGARTVQARGRSPARQ
ncbi:hypothetical protein [Bradyrhizobium sp. USDA 4454]